MITFKRTTSIDEDFIYLSHLFDDYLVDIDGDEKDFYAFYNNKFLENVLVFYNEKTAVGCGGFKKFNETTVELKRMFVHPEHRNKGISNSILLELENWAKELGFKNCILETAPKLEIAIALYKKSGYTITENYEQYIGLKNSLCMKKEL